MAPKSGMNSHNNLTPQCSITPIPAFDDNYIWLLAYKGNAVIVDPGDAQPVLEVLHQQHLTLSAILITHHHHDHTGGVNALLQQYPVPVYAPHYNTYPFPTLPLKEGNQITLDSIQQTFNIMWIPGHTLDHIAYVNQDYLFCGDTLFAAGCGRLFEGTPTQMLASLTRLKNLPLTTQVFCAHEYTSKNIEFALTVEPNNAALMDRKLQCMALRAQGQPTLPSTMGLELATNPYLRCNQAAIIKSANAVSNEEIDVFTSIRSMRNHY